MADWTEQQSDWLIRTRDGIDALLSILLRVSPDLDYGGVDALYGIPKERRKFVKVPSVGLAAYHAGRVAVLGETAIRSLQGKTEAHLALELLREVIRTIPQEPQEVGGDDVRSEST